MLYVFWPCLNASCRIIIYGAPRTSRLSSEIINLSILRRMSRLTRDGTAGPVSRETVFSGANKDREIFLFPPVQLTTSKIGSSMLCCYVYVMTIMSYVIHTLVLSTWFKRRLSTSRKLTDRGIYSSSNKMAIRLKPYD